jgi:hypothetical protein
MTMIQIIIVGVLALVLSGFFVDQAFAQANGGIGGNGTNGGVGGNGATGGSAASGKHGTNANGHNGEGTMGSTGGD